MGEAENHKNIVQLIGIVRVPFCIVSEFCVMGDLKSVKN